MEQNRAKLIKGLMKYDLQNTEYAIFSRENEETEEEEYTFCIRWSQPACMSWEHICNIGGTYDIDYTEEYIYNKIFGY